jgi:hypothetical protein
MEAADIKSSLRARSIGGRDWKGQGRDPESVGAVRLRVHRAPYILARYVYAGGMRTEFLRRP